MFKRFRHFQEAADDFRVVAGAVRDAGAAAELYLAVLRVLDAGGIRGVGDIEHDADIRHEPVGDHARAMAADFLLHGIDGVDGAGRPARRAGSGSP